MIKDFEFLLKRIFFSESYLLKKRLKRAINKGYEKELLIINKFADKSKDALDVGVYRGVYSYKLSQNFKNIHSFEPNPLLFPYLEKNLIKIISNLKLYNLALSNENGITDLKLPLRTKSIFKDNIEELFQLGAATMHPKNKIDNYKYKIDSISPALVVENISNRLTNYNIKLNTNINDKLLYLNNRIVIYDKILENINLVNKKKQGFSIIKKKNKIINSINHVSENDILDIEVYDGVIKSKVVSKI